MSNQQLDDHFKLTERSTSIQQEIRGGMATFLTMSYILLVNPQVLAKVGIPAADVVIATALSSGFASLIAGIFGNLPFGLSPGIGLSAYLVYGLVLGQGMPLHQAFTSCFLSGIILCILSVTGVAHVVMRLIPRSVKLSTVVGMGLQIALVGMTSVNLVVANPQTIVGLGPMDNTHVWFAIFGLILIGSLLFHRVTGAILIGIIILTILTWTMESSFPSSYIEFPSFSSSLSTFIRFDDLDWPRMIPAIVAFLFVGIVDVGGVVFGMSSLANLTDKSGHVPGSLFAFLGCGIGSMVGACFGSTPVIVYVETAAGIKEGSRTGLTGVVIGGFFLLSIFLAPVFSQVPATATAPVSILVGAMMMSQSTQIDWNNMSDAIPAFLTMIIMPFTFSITNGIMFGLLAAICFSVTTGNAVSDLHFCLYGSGSGDENLHGGGEFLPLSRNSTMSIEGDNLVVRSPSLILSKRDADAVHRAQGWSLDDKEHGGGDGISAAGGGERGGGSLLGGIVRSNSYSSMNTHDAL